MSEQRISPTMNDFEMVNALADNNEEVIKFLSEMLRTKLPCNGISNLFVLDRYEIYGNKILKLWKDACGKDMEKFSKTMEFLRANKISKIEVQKKLNFAHILPFVE